MKRIKNFALLLMVLVLSFNTKVFADELSGSDNWNAEFTSEKQMVSNFSTGDFVDVLEDLQPGDSAIFKVTIKNSYPTATDWYMTNEVIESLEDAVEVANAGGYTYLLVYHYPESRNQTRKVRVLYDNYDVGGESTVDTSLEGLYEATDSLKDYFYLDTLYTGESGYINLEVSLDGETQGNDYQDTLAKLQMNFAVELPPESTEITTSKNNSTEEIVYETIEGKNETVVIQQPDTYVQDEDTIKIVHTGDDTNLIALYVLAFVLAILLIVLAIIGIKIRHDMKTGTKNDKAVRNVFLIFFVGLIFASSMKAEASGYSDYSYTVRIFSGDKGTFSDGSDLITVKGIAPGTTLDLTDLLSSIELTQNPVYTINEETGEKEIESYETKYSIRGIRESGRDNDEVSGQVFTVNHDMDVVVAYKIKGGDTAYTVRYVDADTGEKLCEEETYYGYVGERIVVSYKYFEGYSPLDTYNYSFVIKDSTTDANVNYVTFKYIKNSTTVINNEENTSDVIRRTIYIDGDGNIIYEYIPGTVIHIGGNEQVIVIHDGTQNNDGGVVDNNENDVADTIDLDPEDVALSDGGSVISVLPTLLNVLDKSPIGYLLSPNAIMRSYIFMGCLILIGIVLLIILWVCFHNAESREIAVNFFNMKRNKIVSNDSDLYKDILIEQMLDEKDEK